MIELLPVTFCGLIIISFCVGMIAGSVIMVKKAKKIGREVFNELCVKNLYADTTTETQLEGM